MKRGILAGVLALTVLGGPAQAQTLRPQLDYATAAAIRDGCIAWATKEKLAVSIAVFNRQGILIAQAHMDNAIAGVSEIARWKGRSAAIFEAKSSVTAQWGSGIPELATLGGGVSFATRDGIPLGGVGTSGASEVQDEACGMAGIAAAGLIAQDTP